MNAYQDISPMENFRSEQPLPGGRKKRFKGTLKTSLKDSNRPSHPRPPPPAPKPGKRLHMAEQSDTVTLSLQ